MGVCSIQAMDSEQWQRWIAQAHDDFAYGEAGVEDFPRGAAWNFHQAAEKSIKALLLHKGVEFPRTHDLVRLLVFIPEDLDLDENVREAAFLLSSYLPVTRYPGDLPEINSGRARQAMEASRLILSWVAKYV